MDAYDAVVAQWPVEVETLDLESRFGTTRVLAAGPAVGEPLVLLHGGGATSSVWFADVESLARERRVYAVDLICDAGRSRPRRGAVRTRRDVAGWFATVLDGLGVERADVAGHSYGAWVALAAAVETRRVRRLALIDPTTCFAPMARGYVRRSLPAVVFGGERRWRRFLEWETGGRALDPAWLTLVATRAQGRNRAKVVLPKRPSDEELRALDAPVLLVLGGQSQVHDVTAVREHAEHVLREVSVVMLPDATHHTLPQQHAIELDPFLLDFFAKHDPIAVTPR
ncbi:pimeloyl-ACP methyl ester carboxylesterase [Hamadaea flava]|uniref:Alpha/beta fold hydrolase n=1 Tax=Hamadaea flava TaxID=1742688 RepID=A0ABV8LKU8_9ACTN|nr:alpha/beta fold hydrolase [Hamadaea flava]MCP2323834.1 pimeloyl-ACP methyl ester carboxylesterase [Hamadaea flava]